MEVIGESFGDGNAGLEGQHKQDSSMWNAGATRSTQLHYAVELWDMSEVENWLRSRQLARFAANFKENDVVGKVMHMPYPLCRTVLSSSWQRQVVPAQLPCLACPAASRFVVEAWFPPWVVPVWIALVTFVVWGEGGGGWQKFWFLNDLAICLSGPAQAHAKVDP